MPYTLRHGLPQMIERAKTQTVRASVYLDGQAIAPESGTYTLLDSNGGSVVSGAVVVSGTDATYSVSSASVPATLTPSDMWQEKWELTLSGTVYTFYRSAYLVLRILYPVVTDADLKQRHTELGRIKSNTVTSYKPYLDIEWEALQRRLIEQGKRPQLVLDSYALATYHTFRTLSAIYLDCATTGASQYFQLSKTYADLAEQAWGRLQFRYDADADNVVNDAAQAAEAPLFLSSMPDSTNHYLWVRS